MPSAPLHHLSLQYQSQFPVAQYFTLSVIDDEKPLHQAAIPADYDY
jgi:hypothetical protein